MGRTEKAVVVVIVLLVVVPPALGVLIGGDGSWMFLAREVSEAQTSLYSALLQLIPVFILALFLGQNRLGPSGDRRFVGAAWASLQVSAAVLATLVVAAMLYVGEHVVLLDYLILVELIVLAFGLVGTASQVARAADG